MLKAENSPHFALTYLAVLASGATFVPLNPAYTPSEVALLVEDADPVLLVHGAATAVPPEDGKITRATLEADGTGTLTRLAAGLEPDLAIAEMAETDLAAILLTSGTTGRPKGAMLMHRNLSSNVAALHEAWQFLGCRFDPPHPAAVPRPRSVRGVASRALQRRDGAPAGAVRCRRRSQRCCPRVSVFMGVPTFYTRLLDHAGFTRAATASASAFSSAARPRLLPSVFAAFEERTGRSASSSATA